MPSSLLLAGGRATPASKNRYSYNPPGKPVQGSGGKEGNKEQQNIYMPVYEILEYNIPSSKHYSNNHTQMKGRGAGYYF